jgi:SnoaL-like domain
MIQAHNEIASQVGALAVRVDARDWQGLLALFDAQVRVDYTSLFGGEVQTMAGEALIDGWRQLVPGFTHTSHLIGIASIQVDGDRAQADASVTAWHAVDDQPVDGGSIWIVHGCYEMAFIKRAGVWRIAALTLARAWVEGNKDLPRLAGERVKSSVTRAA